MTNRTGLSLITNDAFKKTMNTSCTVNMNNEVIKTDDFVAVVYDEHTEQTTMHSNADAYTLGKAALMIKAEFLKSMEQLSEEDREAVMEAL